MLLASLFLLINLNFPAKAYAQHIVISGVVVEREDAPLPYASIALTSQANEKVAPRIALTDEQGLFELTNLSAGDYVLKVSMLGYQVYQNAISVNGDCQLDTIVLLPDAKSLDEVTVTARRNVLERKSDRIIVDVDAGSFQTSNVMEIFMAMPFMQVKGDEISVNGKRNILVLLNHVPLPGATLKDVLNSMNGNEIDKIDFITTPSARYDASVDAVINIHTKRSQMQGLKGSLNGTYSRGNYGRGNAGLNLTYRKDKWTIDGRYSLIRNDNMTTIANARLFSSPSGMQSIAEEATEFYNYRGHNAKLGLTYTLNEGHKLSLTGNLIRHNTPNGAMTGVSDFSRILWATADSVLTREQDMLSKGVTQHYSINYQGKLDTLGKQVEFIATYTPITSDYHTQMRYQQMRLPNGVLLSELPRIRNENPSDAHIVIIQSDWGLPFRSGWQVNAGFKFSSSRNHTETLQSELVNAGWQILPELTFINRFHEDITASYVEMQRQFAGILLKGGLRAENTRMGVRGIYERHFLDLFPHFTVQQDILDREITLNYRRSISRPGFSQMTPFRIYQDEYLLVEGNLNLRPMYAHQVTLNGNVLKDLFLEFEYVEERDRVLQLPRQQGEVTIYAPMNMDRSEWSANLSYNKQLTDSWHVNAYARGFRYGFKGALNEDFMSGSGYAYNVGLTSSFKLPSDFTIDAIYNYYSPYGYAGWNEWRTNFARLAFRKSFLDKKAQLILAFNDIFMGQRYRSDLSAGNLYLDNVNYNDTQRISLGIVLNFGKTTVKAAGNEKLGNEDVINRVN